MNQLIYQTSSFSENSKCPTEEHTELAIKNSLRTPATSRFHTRIWFPHRAGMIDQWWDWHRDQTHHNGGPGLRNCKHVALWCMVPEEDHVHEYHKDGLDQPLHNSVFANYDLGYNHFLHQEYYTFINFQVYEYARTMTELGYNVGFSACIMAKPKNFNRTFGKHFNDNPVIPIIALYVGTDGDVIQHTPQRDWIADMDVSGELVGVPTYKVPPHTRRPATNSAVCHMPFFKPENGKLEPLSEDEVHNVKKVTRENLTSRETRD